MKKVQRSFVVEYKSGRQKLHPKSASIWGNMDLKPVARDVEEDAMPFVADMPVVKRSNGDRSPSTAASAVRLSTPPIGLHTTATGEAIMADDIDTMTETDAPAVVETSITPKKRRKPRAKKASSEVASVEIVTESAVASTVAPEKQRRGRKAKSIDATGSAKRAPVRRPPKAVQVTSVSPTEPAIAAAGDEMADLFQLEEENQRLRKLLAEKLRAENADMRKRLKLD
ncbi:transcriptional regulator [Rhizobium sp. XQZ8]|uniref:transcriptional regulator n=1 Tax=Rhizobium populisoli TaxID=2859785 RepID=UPI001CA51C4B|nr:transcriptional regulator [Rhizobium populisoli]MBW6426174.1 transcriptional regulator [Rhizobium populisoli]